MSIDTSCWCESSNQECASPDCKNRPHTPTVVRAGGRYPYRGACTGCDWQSARGYVAEHAARDMAEDHVEKSSSIA
ncbi:hypothetical protein [Nocardia gipuzkoensis]|uniref:hypothetical protein n=1 Tax=Nocardia gipuzkoensis TaxID=2749991 RepID=UPI00237D8397|nr:hypothetical protein [Nocardia gipuzkoensis]MDE1673787.1 hypothetical protein [Nocardia gipuzkoensis]